MQEITVEFVYSRIQCTDNNHCYGTSLDAVATVDFLTANNIVRQLMSLQQCALFILFLPAQMTLTMKLFPAKISEQAKLQRITLH